MQTESHSCRKALTRASFVEEAGLGFGSDRGVVVPEWRERWWACQVGVEVSCSNAGGETRMVNTTGLKGAKLAR